MCWPERVTRQGFSKALSLMMSLRFGILSFRMAAVCKSDSYLSAMSVQT